jgi:hypothetical protein
MTLGFFTVFRRDPQHYVCARLLVRSARYFMPCVELVQLTDEKSPVVPGVDRVVRLPHGPMLERRLEHYAACQGEWMLFDTDTVLQQDVRSVFDQPFDVALTDRQWSHVVQSQEFMRDMPFNTGVCFSRSPAFWQAVLETWRGYTLDQQGDWMSEQRAVAEVVRRDVFTVMVLPGMVYNYPPTTKTDEGLATAAVCHFKGKRKAWMIERAHG